MTRIYRAPRPAIRRGAQLVGGNREIAAIVSAVQRGKCCRFIGPRHQYKSQLMRAARTAAVERLECLGIYVSLWDAYKHTPRAFFQSVCDLVVKDTRQSSDQRLPRSVIHTSADLTRFLGQIPDRARRNTALFVDDLEREAIPPAFMSELLIILRAAYQNTAEGLRFLAVVCASNSLARTALGPTSPFENISDLVSVCDLDLTETEELTTQLLRAKRKTPTANALSYIYEQTLGDRFLISQVCEECCRLIGARQRVTRNIARTATEHLVRSVSQGPLAEGIRELESDPRLLKATLDLMERTEIPAAELPFSPMENPDPLVTSGFVVKQQEGYRIKSPLHYHLLKHTLSPERVGRIFLAAGEWERAIDSLQADVRSARDGIEWRSQIMLAAASAMYSMPDHAAAIAQLVHGLHHAYPRQTIRLYEWDSRRGELRLVTLPGESGARPAHALVGASVSLEQLQTSQEYWWQIVGRQRIIMFVPLRTPQGENLGLVVVENLVTQKDFHHRQAQILELVGYLQHAARALKNRIEYERLHKQVTRRAGDLENLVHVTEKLMSAQGSFDEVLKQALDAALKTLQGRAQMGSIWIYHSDKGVLTMDADSGYSPRVKRAAHFRPGEGVAGYVYSNGRLWNCHDTMHDQHYIDLTGGNGVQPCAMLGMPLLGRRSTLGVLFLDNTEHPEAFDEDDERLMQIFAGQVALWLERVRVMDTLSQKRDVARLAAELVHQLTGTIAGVPEVADEIKTEMARAPELHKAARLADELQRKATVVAQIGRWVDRFIRLDRMSLREFDVSELIIEVCQRLRERQPSNISIHPPQGDPALPLLRADRMLISVLLENLIENAFDAIPAGHCGQIDLNVEQHDEFFVIQMWDNGQGIPHENRKKIWEVGYSTKSRQGIKRGLGLTLCLRIVKAHDGNIQVDDSPTGGARFTIQLPVAGPQAQFEEDNVPV